MKVAELVDPRERSRICESILRDLPEWFGIESAIVDYVREVAGLPTFVAGDAGFLSLKTYGSRAAEIYVMGVRRACQCRGVGTALVAAAEDWARARGIEYLQVKTLGPSRESRAYADTRRFYERRRFVPLEELHGLWAEGNPTLVLVKRLDDGLRVLPVRGLAELGENDDLAGVIAAAVALEDGDVVVVAQKVVSKVEGRVTRLDELEPSDRARELAGDEDPRRIEAILREAVRVVRVRPPLVIAETRHGFVCASAGVDLSNAPEAGMVVLLPLDPDASAERLRARFRELVGAGVGVIVSDSFGRPWRQGTIDVAIGVAGLTPLLDLRGRRDRVGYELHATQIAVADEIASAAELVMGKTDGVPGAVVRGLHLRGDGRAGDILIPEERDLFR